MNDINWKAGNWKAGIGSRVALVLTLAAAPTLALADISGGGCTDSPENATAVLGLLGAGAASLPWLRARLSARRRDHETRLESDRP
jgi:hypothetical protein